MTTTRSGAETWIDRDELLTRVHLADVLDALTTSEGGGRQRRWRCPAPDHPDTRPSVTIATDHHGVERWRCWSGGHGGTAIDAVIASRQLTVGEAIRWLNDHHAHLQPQPRQPQPATSRPVGKPSPHVIEYVERAEQLLWTTAGAEIRAWLNNRGLDDNVLVANRVGADPGPRHLPRRAGLPTGTPAAVLPALDPTGNITYLQARFIDPTPHGQKYANPAGRLATNPKLAWTQTTATEPTRGPLVVTEGIPDALIVASAGIKSVAVLGSAVPTRYIAEQLARTVTERGGQAPDIVICFDADPAGRTGAHRLGELLRDQQAGSTIIIEPPDGMDISDWASSNTDWTERLREHLDSDPEVDVDFDL